MAVRGVLGSREPSPTLLVFIIRNTDYKNVVTYLRRNLREKFRCFAAELRNATSIQKTNDYLCRSVGWKENATTVLILSLIRPCILTDAKVIYGVSLISSLKVYHPKRKPYSAFETNIKRYYL